MIVIHVTQADIDAGQEDSPIRLAAERHFGGTVSVGLDGPYPYIATDTLGDAQVWVLPALAERFQRAWDAGLPVAPFGFALGVERQDIETLRFVRRAEGDLAQVAMCDRALDGDQSAWDECVRVMIEAAA
jgi:hypothetical protein